MESEELLNRINALLTNRSLNTSEFRYLTYLKHKAASNALIDMDREYIALLSNMEDNKRPSDTAAAVARRIPEIDAEIDPLKIELDNANNTINQLRAKGRQVVSERDRFQLNVDELTTHIADLKRKQEVSKLELKRFFAEREKLQADINRLRARLAEGNKADADTKFLVAKRAFAKLYHPNSGTSLGGIEKMIRAEVFKEFWAVLEGIETS